MSDQNWDKCSMCLKVKAGYYFVIVENEGRPVCHKCFILMKEFGSKKVED